MLDAMAAVDLLEKYNGAVTAAATVIIAAYTIVLARVTSRQAKLTKLAADAAEKAANAAKVSAEALPNVERAYLFLDDELVSVLDWPATTTERRRSTIRPILKNYGRTPAILREIRWDVLVLDALPGKREVDDLRGGPVPVSSLVIGSGARSEPLEVQFFIEGSDVDQIELGRGRFMYFVGRVRYDDVFHMTHETGFCIQYRRSSGTFDAAVSDKLNYHT